MGEYILKRERTAVYDLYFHLVFVTKYRKVLALENGLNYILKQKSSYGTGICGHLFFYVYNWKRIN